MKKLIQFHIYKGEKYFVAECTDLPIVTQAKTLDELTANIKEALDLHLEGENLEDFDLVPEPSVVANIELDSLIYA
jgi:predicted RNase H-like HicB family nuclease